MRKFKLLALALVIGTASVFATNGDDPKEANKKIRNQIVNLLQDADFIVENETTVNLTFTFSSQGEIIVLKVDSRDKNILNFVRENLNYKKVNYPGERDKLYTMPLKVTAS
jgi:transposase